MPALKPSGWLIIEDFDAGVDPTILMADRRVAAAFDRVWKCTWASFEKRGCPRNWGRQLENAFAELNLDDTSVDANFQLFRGNSAYSELYKRTIHRVNEEAVREGWASHDDIAMVLAAPDQPEFMAFSNVLYSASGPKIAEQ